MIRDERNLIPISLAVLLHVVVFGALVFAIDFAPRSQPITPLVLTATLMEDIPPVVEERPEPEPVVEDKEPEPVIEEPEPEAEPEPEPEPPKPDPAEEARKRAEEQKRLDDLRIEQERKEREERIKREKEEAERKRREEEELERKRQEAERKRQEDIRRQREENERRRREQEEAARQAEIAAEERLTEARSSDDMTRYMFALQQKVVRNWARPASARAGLDCVVRVRQTASGDVISVNVVSCNGDEAVVRSIEAAVRKASPLPVPANPILFEPDLRFVFKPEQ
ncbi:MAG: TonB C-terminal domain-containing protein [Woeseiaceae bacterium]|nr:TonB C-terminal domain-containing protein [Woeseiaceae bacterium]